MGAGDVMSVPARLLESLQSMLEREDERARKRGQAIKLLRETIDLALFPTDLLEFAGIAPAIYNAGTRRFEMQRTPNKQPTGILAFAGAGVASVRNAVSVGSIIALDTQPSDGTWWKVLGGIISSTVQTTVQVRQEGGTKVVTTLIVPANTSSEFNVPGNGVQLDAGKTVEIAVAAATNVEFTLYVSEESDTTGRGGS